MIEKIVKAEAARFVEGDFPIWFVYTAGVAGEKFLRALKQKKVLASTCPKCSTTYCPPRIYCETCLEEIEGMRAVKGTGRIESWTRLHVGLDGAPLRAPVLAGAIRMDGTDGTLVHRILSSEEEVAIGAAVTPVWAKKTSGSLLDIEGFRVAKGGRR